MRHDGIARELKQAQAIGWLNHLCLRCRSSFVVRRPPRAYLIPYRTNAAARLLAELLEWDAGTHYRVDVMASTGMSSRVRPGSYGRLSAR